MNKQIIHNWDELASINPESSTHILEIEPEKGCGWIISKYPKPDKKKLSFMRQIKHKDIYLSTHSFYKEKDQYKYTEKILNACGFNVKIEV